jgi:hypothetical protein
MTDREVMQQALEALEFDGFTPEDETHRLLHTKAITALRAALEQQAEPVAWDKPSASFNAWWDSYRHDPANPFAEGSAAYWAWAGWQAAQRKWQGLTDEDVNRESAPIAQQMKLAFHAGMYVAQKILKEKNNG